MLVDEAAQRLGELDVVDVRQPDEWEAGRIEGSRHIPLTELVERQAELDKSRPILFVCTVGGRSGRATEAFRRAGYEAENLEGGLLAWTAAGLPLTTPSGEPGIVAQH